MRSIYRMRNFPVRVVSTVYKSRRGGTIIDRLRPRPTSEGRAINEMQYWNYSSKGGWVVHDLSMYVGTCPRCHGPAQRIPRRPIDRLLSRVFPRRRYRCESPACGWQGNLPIENGRASDLR